MVGKSKISVTQFPLSTLIIEMSEMGTIRVPRFQRDYVWERKRVAMLFDSIYRKFPIGSFFLWIVPRELRTLYKQIPELGLPDPAEFEQIKMILDGQQRLTSLLVAAKGLSLSQNGKQQKDYKRICFDLDGETFAVGHAEDRVKTVSVWRLFDDEGSFEIFKILSPERQKVFERCKLALRGYPLSIVQVDGVNLDDAVVIFTRINQQGKKLSLFDLVVAKTWSNDFDLKAKAKELNRHLNSSGFGEVDEEVFTQTLGLVVKDSCTSSSQLNLENKDVKDNWKPVAEGVKLAVDFLKGNLGVRVAEFLPYPSMVGLVAAFFARKRKPSLSAEEAAFVKEWFWKAAFAQRYAKALLTVLGEDWNKYFKPATLSEVPELEYRIAIREKDLAIKIYTRSAIKNAVLCLLALKGPLHFKNGTVITLDDALCSKYNDRQKHH